MYVVVYPATSKRPFNLRVSALRVVVVQFHFCFKFICFGFLGIVMYEMNIKTTESKV